MLIGSLVSRGNALLIKRSHKNARLYEPTGIRVVSRGMSTTQGSFNYRDYLKPDPKKKPIHDAFKDVLRTNRTHFPAISEQVYDLINHSRETIDTLTPDQLIFLGVHHHYGLNGYQQDLAYAKRLYDKAAEKGDARGPCNIGILEAEKNNHGNARALFQLSSEKAPGWANLNLAFTEEGKNSFVHQTYLLEESSVSGNHIASYLFGRLLSDRTSDPFTAQSKAILSLSQAPGFAPALTLYARGCVDGSDYSEDAYLIFKEAAELGDPDAAYFRTSDPNIPDTTKEKFLKQALEGGSLYAKLKIMEDRMETLIKEKEFEEVVDIVGKMMKISQKGPAELELRIAEVLKDHDIPLKSRMLEQLHTSSMAKGNLSSCQYLLDFYTETEGEFSDQVFKVLQTGGQYFKCGIFLEKLARFFDTNGPKADAVLYNSIMREAKELSG